MFRRLAPLVLSALAVVGLSSLASAQQCPNSCPASYTTNTTGAFAPGDMVTLVPTALTNAQSALLGVVGGGFVCNTCVPCSVKITVSWRIVTTACVSYNNCGLLQNGVGSGTAATTLTQNCNDPGLNLRLDYGTCNITGMCPPPVVSPAAWTLTSVLTCGNCQ
jgi:hypothetical protein